MPMVLKFALKVGGIPSPVEVSGPPVVDNPSLPGNPLGPTGPIGPIAPSLPGGPVLPLWPLCPRSPLRPSPAFPPPEGSFGSYGGPPSLSFIFSLLLPHINGLALLAEI